MGASQTTNETALISVEGIRFQISNRDANVTWFDGTGRILLRPVLISADRVHIVAEIQSKAFSKSSLDFIILPRTVVVLGSECFCQCASPDLFPLNTIQHCGKFNWVHSVSPLSVQLLFQDILKQFNCIVSDAAIP
jgi:hypothetical protein